MDPRPLPAPLPRAPFPPRAGAGGIGADVGPVPANLPDRRVFVAAAITSSGACKAVRSTLKVFGA